MRMKSISNRNVVRLGTNFLLICRCFTYSPLTQNLLDLQWNKIIAMRQRYIAPVDTMGADALAKRDQKIGAEFRFQTLIATMLSPQTRDEQTTAAYENLRSLVNPHPFLPNELCKFNETQIEEAIQSVSFYKTKAKHILQAATICKDTYNNDIPDNIDELMQFKGIGPKIAYLTFTIAYNKTYGICVDTHVHRISNRLGWVNTWNSKSNGPEKTRMGLEKILPQEKWEKVNNLLVGFGQTICTAKTPKCIECSLKDNCLFYNNNMKIL